MSDSGSSLLIPSCAILGALLAMMMCLKDITTEIHALTAAVQKLSPAEVPPKVTK